MRLALRDREGRAGVNLDALQMAVERRRELLAQAIDAFSGLKDPAVYAAKLADLEAGVEQAEAELEDGREAAGVTVQGGLAWDEMGVQTRRNLIRLAVESAVVLADKGLNGHRSSRPRHTEPPTRGFSRFRG